MTARQQSNLDDKALSTGPLEMCNETSRVILSHIALGLTKQCGPDRPLPHNRIKFSAAAFSKGKTGPSKNGVDQPNSLPQRKWHRRKTEEMLCDESPSKFGRIFLTYQRSRQ
jgi:hypothetical protein